MNKDNEYSATAFKCKSGGYWGIVNEIPGAASQGEDIDKLKVNLGIAIKAILASNAKEASENIGAFRAKNISISEPQHFLVPCS